MSFFLDIKKCFTDKELSSLPCYRALLLGDGACYFENIKTIVSYDDKQVIMNVRGGGLRVKGKGLYIKKYCQGDVVICGKINAVEKI